MTLNNKSSNACYPHRSNLPDKKAAQVIRKEGNRFLVAAMVSSLRIRKILKEEEKWAGAKTLIGFVGGGSYREVLPLPLRRHP